MSEPLPPRHHLGHRLAGWVDGELPPGTKALVAAHLAMCSTCRVAAVKESRTKADLRDLGGPAPSNDLMASLLNLPGSAPVAPSAPPSVFGTGSFPTAAARRRPPVAPLLAAGVAGVAALTVGSAWLAADGAPQNGDSRFRQASTGVVDAGLVGGVPTDLPDGPQTSFATIGTGPAMPGVARPVSGFVEVLRLR